MHLVSNGIVQTNIKEREDWCYINAGCGKKKINKKGWLRYWVDSNAKTSLCVWLGNSSPKESLWPQNWELVLGPKLPKFWGQFMLKGQLFWGNFLCEIKWLMGNWLTARDVAILCTRVQFLCFLIDFNWFLHNLTLIWLVFGSSKDGSKHWFWYVQRVGLNSKLKYSDLWSLPG